MDIRSPVLISDIMEVSAQYHAEGATGTCLLGASYIGDNVKKITCPEM
jgi:hypothetical protein